MSAGVRQEVVDQLVDAYAIDDEAARAERFAVLNARLDPPPTDAEREAASRVHIRRGVTPRVEG